jgi:hypothetical protein
MWDHNAPITKALWLSAGDSSSCPNRGNSVGNNRPSSPNGYIVKGSGSGRACIVRASRFPEGEAGHSDN